MQHILQQFSPLAQSLIWEILSQNVAATASCALI
jgi:hypothetical protein